MDMEMEKARSRFKKVCVFCGSSLGKKGSFQDAAVELGKELVSRNIDLVYGGGSVGLMGAIAQTVHEGGGHVLGVTPKTLIEVTGETVGEVKVVADMHQRKAEMARQSDAFIALPSRIETSRIRMSFTEKKSRELNPRLIKFVPPGGYGTLEELLEVITWAQLSIHDKPVGVLNVDGYYNSLISLFDKAVQEGFISPTARYILVSAPTARELLKKLEDYVPTLDQVASKL